MPNTPHVDALGTNEEYVPRAFLVSKVRKDVSSASMFGTITHLFNGDSHIPSIWSEGFQRVLINELNNQDFDPTVDFIIVSGEMVTVSVAIAAITAAFEQIRLLCYDARSGNYNKVQVGVEQIHD